MLVDVQVIRRSLMRRERLERFGERLALDRPRLGREHVPQPKRVVERRPVLLQRRPRERLDHRHHRAMRLSRKAILRPPAHLPHSLQIRDEILALYVIRERPRHPLTPLTPRKPPTPNGKPPAVPANDGPLPVANCKTPTSSLPYVPRLSPPSRRRAGERPGKQTPEAPDDQCH